MSGVLVSILVCTYNGERYLAKQLNSLLSQTYSNTEIIIVDDASTDNTFKVLEGYRDNKKVSIFTNPINKGFTRNFSDGLSLCKGEFIAFSDQDDIWENEKITLLVDSIGSNDAIYHDSSFIDESGCPTGNHFSSFHNFVKGDCSSSLIYQNAASGHTMMIRGSFIKHFNPIPSQIYHDWWISFCAACHGSLTYVENKLVNYRIHTNSYTQLNPKITFEDRAFQLALFEEYSKKLKAKSYPLLSKLNTLYRRKRSGRFSFSLFFTLLFNVHTLFHIRKRSIWSKLVNIINESKASKS